jgi:glycerophosphoryl diester phosphodiesterase
MRSFDLQGHRGARALFPENTIEGFAATLGIGVDTIELDVALTADGVVVVTHDAALNPDLTRGPDGAWLAASGPAVRTLTLAELRRFDVGRLRPDSTYARLFPQQVPRDGVRIPTVAEVLALTMPAGVRVEAELKTLPGHPDATVLATDMADAVVAAATAAGALPLLGVRSFDWRGPRHLRRHHPEIRLTWLTRDDTVGNAARWWDGPVPADFGGSVPAAVAAEARAGQPVTWTAVWAPEHHGLTRELLAEAHALGLGVVPWTVNAPADMARLIGWGVDGMCSDRPDLVRAGMAAAGLKLPRPVSGA